MAKATSSVWIPSNSSVSWESLSKFKAERDFSRDAEGLLHVPVWSCRNRTIVESIHLFLSPICSILPEVRHNNMKLTVLNQVRLWFVLLRWIWLSTSMIYQYEPKVNEGHSGSRFEQNDAWAKSIKDYDASFSCQLIYYLQMCLDDPM